MKRPKFIVIDNGDEYEIICGNVELHMDLVPNDTVKVIGGGHFYIDYRNKCIYFYGKSIDYGVVQHTILNKVVERNGNSIRKQISEIRGIANPDEITRFRLMTDDIPYFLL